MSTETATAGKAGNAPQLVSLTIDGKEARVPKGTNLLEAARSIGVEVPFYCYHPHLSVAGNCRMCTMKVEGQGKLAIGCGTPVAEGMKVQSQATSKEVADAQAATLEFILINHPLDCTVCDQAGHCKLQDYHYEYNARPSRFVEEKVHKIKAEPLGPTVSLDGERCIMCTRCVRFCDEITGTSELGMLNRGDRSVIAVNPGRELNNPLSGTVVDLCPVGALTHRNWRFNTRIWFTKESEGICPGCSTGCNVKVAVRDGEVVQVKARQNAEVNKEWLCDEGRYGFMRFLPEKRLSGVVSRAEGGKLLSVDEGAIALTKFADQETAILLAPDLLLEDYRVIKHFAEKVIKKSSMTLAYAERSLTKVESILISPDYAANFRGAEWVGMANGELEARYRATLADIRSGKVKRVLIIGDRAVGAGEIDSALLAGIRAASLSVFIGTDASSPLAEATQFTFGGRSILERSGLLVNRNMRLQYTAAALDPATTTEPVWKILARAAHRSGVKITAANSDRDLTLEFLAGEPRLLGLRIASIVRQRGVCLKSYQPGSVESSSLVEARSLG